MKMPKEEGEETIVKILNRLIFVKKGVKGNQEIYHRDILILPWTLQCFLKQNSMKQNWHKTYNGASLIFQTPSHQANRFNTSQYLIR